MILPAVVVLLAAAVPVQRPVTVAAAQPDSLHVRVVATHDFHGALQPQAWPWSDSRLVGGAAALKAYMDSAESRCGCPTFRLDGGDQLQGTLESNMVHGASVVHAFNLLRLDAAAVGNHELDWGVDTLIARQAQARYAWLAANVFRRGTDERPAWAQPFALIERNGARVAVIGYSTQRTPATLRAATTTPYEFRGGLDGIAAALRDVARFEPDFTIIVAHAGGGCMGDSCTGEMVELARALDSTRVQLIVGGHEHFAMNAVVNGIPIVRGSSSGRAISVVDLIRLPDGGRRAVAARDTLYVDRVDPDTDMQALLEPYFARADSIAHAPVALLRDSLSQRRTEHLGNLITDALRSGSGSRLALSNTGGIRAPLAAGTVTYNDLFRVTPFGNLIVVVTVSGRQLREIVEHAVSLGAPDDLAGMYVEFDPGAPPGSRVVRMTLDVGTPILDDDIMTLAVPDFLADGGGGYDMLPGLPQERLEVSMLDALVAHLRALPQPVVAPGEARAVRTRR